MLEKLRKFRQSHFILRITVLASILLNIYTFVLRSFVTGVADHFIGDLYGFAIVLLSVVFLIIHKLWFSPEYKGSFRMDLLKEKSVIIPLVVYLVIDIGMNAFNWSIEGIQMPTLVSLALVLMSGIGEEVCYRVIIMTTELRIWIRKGSYLPALLIASLLFGLGHLSNVFAGATLSATLLQVFATIASGLFMGSLFIRTGNVMLPIGVHILHNLMSLMTAGASVVNSHGVSFEGILFIGALAVAQIIISVWLLKGRKEEIVSVWKERWSVTEE